MSTIVLKSCTVDLGRSTITPNGSARDHEVQTLTTREADLLRYLAERPSISVSRDELLTQVWGYSDAVVTRVCDNTLHRLREKLEVDPKRPDHLITAHGTGYRFEPLPGEPSSQPQPQPQPAEATVTLDEEATLDLPRARVERQGKVIELSAAEVSFLRRLMRASGAVVAREVLIRELWGPSRTAGRAIDHAVRRLRAKIERDPSDPRHLLTGGGGYRLELPQAPRAAGDLFGRDSETETLRALTARGGFTLLLGPPGAGKTALARQMLREHPSASLVVARACSTADDLVAAIAMVLLVPIEGGSSASEAVRGTERTGRALAAKGRHLLVLDTLEGVAAEAGPVIEALLALAPELHLLGTSRISVGVRAGSVLEVSALDEPSAVELFVDRALKASRSTRFDPDELADIRELVRTLDYNPLAIELIAARTPVASPRALLARIKERPLDLLGPLRAALDDVISTLDPRQLRALLVLSLFQRGATLEDAEVLLGEGALDLLQGLRDHSLLYGRPRGGGELRLSSFDAVRARGRAILSEQPDGGRAITLAHVSRFARFGEEEHISRLYLEDADKEREMYRVQVSELAHAARLALSIGERELAARAARAATHIWRVEGALALPRQLCDEVLASKPEPSLATGYLALSTAQACLDANVLVESHERFDVTLSIALAVGDDTLLSMVYAAMATLALEERDFPRRVKSYEMAYTHAAATPLRAHAALCAARSIVKDDRAAAEQLLLEGLAHCGANLHQRAVILADLGQIAWHGNRLGEASARIREAFECQRALGYRRFLPHRAAGFILVAIERGDFDAAAEMTEIGLSLAREMGSVADEANLLSMFGHCNLVSGRSDEALALLSRARLLLEKIVPPRNLPYVEMRLVDVYLTKGDMASAAALAQRGAERAEKAGNRWIRAIFSVQLALAEAHQGSPHEGRARAESALAVLFEVARPIDQLVGLCRLGQITQLQGDRARTEEVLAQAERLASVHGLVRPQTEGATALAALRYGMGSSGR